MTVCRDVTVIVAFPIWYHHLADDVTFASACRALLEPSQQCLFASVELRNPDQLSRLLNIFRHSTHLPKCVHNLELREISKFHKPCQWITRPTTIDLLLEFFPMVTGITTFSLQLSGFKSWRELPKPFQVTLMLFFHGSHFLERLRLPVIINLPLDLFSHCSNLQYLRLSQGVNDMPGKLDDDIPKTRWPPHIHRLKGLDLFYIGKPGTVHSSSPSLLLSNEIDTSSLESLEVVAVYTLPNLLPILEAGTLRNLVLRPIGFRYQQADIDRSLDLSKLNLLESLTITDSWDGSGSVLPWLPPTLGSLSPSHPHLKSVKIVIDVTDIPSPASAQCFTDIRNVLASLHQTSPGVLKSVYIEFHALRTVIMNTPKVKALCEPHLFWPGSDEVLEVVWKKSAVEVH